MVDPGAARAEQREPEPPGGLPGSELVHQARALADKPGDEEHALVAYREAVAATDWAPSVLLEYARFLLRESSAHLAEDVLALLLARDGAQLDALELYLELIRELELPATRAKWALERLSASVVERPEAHRGALDYAIPFRLEPVLEAIGKGPDAVSRAVVQINAAYRDRGAPDEALQSARGALSPNDLLRAHLTAVLGRGNRDVAMRLLIDADPEAVPIDSLRRAIRRARGSGQDKRAVQYLGSYVQVRPDDAWANDLLVKAKRDAESNMRLRRSGFPFPDMRPEPEYEAQSDHVFYLLHNSLPHNSAGYATRTHGLLSELNRSGWVVDGVTRLGYPYDMPGKAKIPDVAPEELVGNVTYRRLLRGKTIEKKDPLYGYTQRYANALTQLAREHRPAVLHAASNHWNGLTAVAAARELGIPSIYEVRGLWEVTRASRAPEFAQGSQYEFMARMEADAAKGATRVFAITAALRDELVRRGVDGGKIELVPNGVDTSRFSPLPRDEELAERLGLADKTVIGYVGSVLDYEGIELMISAAEELRRSRSDFHVLIVGDGAELERFRSYVGTRSLGHIVTFTGRVPHEEVERYYSLIDITPFPRLPLPVCEMVSPLKPFEAMAMGKAVIASDVGALAEFVHPGVNGFLHEKGSADSLRVQLARLLDDRDLVRQTGEQAREWVVRERDWSVVARTISDAYGELVGRA